MKKGDVVAVYGTLRKGQGANGYFKDRAKYLGKSRISAKLYRLGWYPGIKLGGERRFISEGPTVVVDLYEIEDERLPAMLDGYEGYPSLYGRDVVEDENGKEVWVYEYNGSVQEDRLISSGDWEEGDNNVSATA